MKQEANPADYIPKARSTPGAEYEGSYEATTYDEFRKRHPWLLRWEGLKLAISEWWHELRSKRLPESDYWERYKELHAGRSILLDAMAHVNVRVTHDGLIRAGSRSYWARRLILERAKEIEREIEEVKR
jgi:hypothetical protein